MQERPHIIYELKSHLHHDFPEVVDITQLFVEVKYAMKEYNVTDIIGCLTDGNYFLYYKLSNRDGCLVPIWKKIFLYNDNLKLCMADHLNFLRGTIE